MQTTMAVEDIKMTLPELLDSLTPGDEVILTRNHRPVAKLVSEKPPERKPRVPGLGKGMLKSISDDEDHLKDFAEYMPSFREAAEGCSDRSRGNPRSVRRRREPRPNQRPPIRSSPSSSRRPHPMKAIGCNGDGILGSRCDWSFIDKQPVTMPALSAKGTNNAQT